MSIETVNTHFNQIELINRKQLQLSSEVLIPLENTADQITNETMPDCIHWKGYKPCNKQKIQGLANCCGCSFYEEGNKIIYTSNNSYTPETLHSASSIGIVEMGGLGSIVRTTAITKRIREINPRVEIYWYTHTRGKNLLQYVPGVNVIDVESNSDCINTDVLINFETSEAAKNIVLNSNCVAGFAINSQGNFYGVTPYAVNFQRLQIDDVFRKNNTKNMQQILMESIGLEYSHVDYDIKLRPENFVESENIIFKEFGHMKFDSLLGVNIGTSQKGSLKRWQPDKYAKLIGAISSIHPSNGILVLSGPEDSDIKTQVIDILSKGKNTNNNVAVLSNDIEIGNFMAIINRCDLLLTSDTFAYHVAQALKVPSIVMCGPMPDTELEINTSVIKIGPKLKCSPCYYKCTQPISGQCMIDIQEQEVLEAINIFLNNTNS